MSAAALAIHLTILSIGLGLVVARRCRAGSRGEAPGHRFEPARWTGADILLALLAYPLGALAIGPMLRGRPLEGALFIALAALPNALVAVVAVQLVALRGQRPLVAFGLAKARLAASAWTGLGGLLRAYPLVFGCHLVVPWAYERLRLRFGWPAPSINPAAERFLHSDSPAELVAVAIFAIAIAPLVEEVFFRGFLHGLLRHRYSPRVAVALSSLGFAVIHPPIDWAPIAVLGVAFALAYERTGSLYAPIVAHAAHNAYGILQLVLARAAGAPG